MATSKASQIDTIYLPVREELTLVEEQVRRAGQVDDFSHLQGLLQYVLEWPGKRIRPVVTLLASRFHEADSERVVLMASAIEMLHIATLVHDDAIDEAHLRRGRSTVSRRWGKETAVLLGDYLFAKSAMVVCQTGSLRVIRQFAQTVMDLSSGELREYCSTTDPEVSIESYLRRIGGKTASLFATAAETGAVLSSASEEDVAALRDYGLNLGLAFQIADDILDFEGDEKVAGKPVGTDLSQGVITLPAILLAGRFPDQARVIAALGRNRDPEKIKEAVGLVRASSIIDEANEIAEAHCRQARQALSALPDIAARRALAELTDYVTRREK